MRFFAVGLKIVPIAKSLDNANLLQSDLNAFIKYLSSNINKCKLMCLIIFVLIYLKPITKVTYISFEQFFNFKCICVFL